MGVCRDRACPIPTYNKKHIPTYNKKHIPTAIKYPYQ
jgi:hypothetical protein